MNAEEASTKFNDDVRRLRECLQRTSFLDKLKMAELEKLMSAIKKLRVPAGHTLFRQGDKGDTFYLVSQGQLSFWVRKGLKDKKLTVLRPMDYFGETALIDDAPRSATVIADTESELFLLRKENFRDILMANPGIAGEIREQMARKTQIKKDS
jgi:trk system potassium uptake protein TrkA